LNLTRAGYGGPVAIRLAAPSRLRLTQRASDRVVNRTLFTMRRVNGITHAGPDRCWPMRRGLVAHAGSPTTLGSDWQRRSYLAWGVLACSVLLTVLAWDVASRSLRERVREQFVVQTEQIAHAIHHRMLEYEAALRGVTALFVASDDVTRDDFRRYFNHLELERLFPGIQGVGFARMTTADELRALTEHVRGEGHWSFAVRPPGTRELYTPIIYLEPFAGRNMRAFGFDMFSEPVRREAMLRALRTRRPATSGVVTLVQETEFDRQSGFLMYLPVFRRSESVGKEDAEKLHGYVYAPFRARDLMLGILGRLPNEIDYAITDGESAKLLFDTRTGMPARASKSALTRTKSIDVTGRRWRLHFWARAGFGHSLADHEPLGVLVAGIIINLLLFYIIGSSTTLQRRAHQLAEEMTQAVTASHAREHEQMRASLREKETLLKEIHHRVKNNLQLVSSLLSLQTNQLTDERTLAPLRHSQQRVSAMAALHEFLYQSHDFSRVDTNAYLSHLVAMLSEVYQPASGMALKVEIEHIALDIDRAIACGLILNELVSNAFKHAFTQARRGHLRVALHATESEVTMEVEDDGPGFDSALIDELPSTLGLQLVRLLTEQLRGTLTVTTERGVLFSIRFPWQSSGRSHGS